MEAVKIESGAFICPVCGEIVVKGEDTNCPNCETEILFNEED